MTTLLSIPDVAQITGHNPGSLYRLVELGKIPAPTHTRQSSTNDGLAYTPAEVKDVLGKLVEAHPTPNTAILVHTLVKRSEVARMLGISANGLQNYIQQGIVPAPTHGPTKVKRYTPHEVEEMAENIKEWRKRKPEPRNPANKQKRSRLHDSRRGAGYVSIPEVAKLAGLATITVQYHLRRNNCPAPQHAFNNLQGYYYAREDVQAVLAWLERNTGLYNRRIAARRGKGYYSRRDIAQAIGSGVVLVAAMIRKGVIPSPSHARPGNPHGNLYYNKEEYHEIVEQAKKYLVSIRSK